VIQQVCFEREELFLYSVGRQSQRARFASVEDGTDLPECFLGLTKSQNRPGIVSVPLLESTLRSEFELTAVRLLSTRQVERVHIYEIG
jgi:hypothetical protein